MKVRDLKMGEFKLQYPVVSKPRMKNSSRIYTAFSISVKAT